MRPGRKLSRSRPNGLGRSCRTIAIFSSYSLPMIGSSFPGVTTRERFLSVVGSGALTYSEMYQGRSNRADEWTTDVFEHRAGRWLCARIPQARHHLTSRAP